MGRDRVDRDQQPVGSRIQILELLRDDLALASDVTSEIFRVRSPFPVDLTRLDGVASKGQHVSELRGTRSHLVDLVFWAIIRGDEVDEVDLCLRQEPTCFNATSVVVVETTWFLAHSLLPVVAERDHLGLQLHQRNEMAPPISRFHNQLLLSTRERGRFFSSRA